MRRLGWIVVATLLVTAGAAAAQPAPTFFRWLDAKGNLHVTDRLSEVPEPYHAMYAARLKELEAQKQAGGKVAPAAATVKPATAEPKASAAESKPARVPELSFVEQELARQQKWKALVVRWRTELEQATRQYETAQTRLNQARLNPILRTTPKARADIARFSGQLERAKGRVEQARMMLLETLPAQAKKESVPPKWLE